MFDQVSDTNNATLYQISQEVNLPEFVKEASLPDSDSLQTLSPDCFAYPELRRFPVHTKADTWLSAAYLHKSATTMSPCTYKGVRAAVEEAAAFWQIDLPRFDTIKEASAAPDPVGTYPVVFEVGGTAHTTHVSSADELTKVAAHIIESEDYPYLSRQGAARQVIAAPSELKREITNDSMCSLHKLAGYGVGTLDVARLAIRQRRNALSGPLKSVGEEMAALDSMLKEAASEATDNLLSSELLSKTAAMLDVVDKVTSLCTRYTDTFRPGYEQIFETTMHDVDAFAKEAVELRCGEVVSRQDLRAARVGAWLERCFGEKVASEDQLVEAVESMSSRRSSILYKHVQTTLEGMSF
jgi:hypothetical protein